MHIVGLMQIAADCSVALWHNISNTLFVWCSAHSINDNDNNNNNSDGNNNNDDKHHVKSRQIDSKKNTVT